MTAKRLLMRQLRAILRLKFEQKAGNRAIARARGVGRGDSGPRRSSRASFRRRTIPTPEHTLFRKRTHQCAHFTHFTFWLTHTQISC